MRINNALKNPWIPLIFRILALIGFVIILSALYFGSIKLIFNVTNTFVMFAVWTLWWPFLYLSLLFLGRFWCGFICPIGLANEIGNALRKTKKNYLSKYAFLPSIILILVVFWEQISGLFFSTNLTLLFLLGFIVLALILGMLLPRWGFCKYFCPLGTILGIFSRLSFVGVRTNKKTCEKCKTKECIRGGKAPPCPLFNYVPEIESNQNCLLCTNCIKNCPYDSAKLCLVKPGEEIKKKAGFNVYESLFIISFLALATSLTSKGTQIGRIFMTSNINGTLLRAWDFAFWIFIFLVFYFLITFISTKLDKKYNIFFKENLIKGGYVFLPLLFSIMFFLIVFGFMASLTNINSNWISTSKYVLISIGSVWGIKLSLSLFKEKAWIYILSILLIAIFWVIILVPGPLNVITENANVYFIKDGEILSMTAFSMGFDPPVIEAKTGSSFIINITSIDIAHSFDIDDLDIHMSFKGGNNLNIKLNDLKPGEYEYYCIMPGHKEAGMKGTLIVR